MQAVIKNLKQKYLENFNYIRDKWPDLFQLLSLQGKEQVEIEIISQDFINISVNNNLVYSVNPQHYCRTKIENFLENPHKIRLDIENIKELSILSQKMLINIQKLAEEYGANFKKPKFISENDFHLLIIEGLNLGYHLDYLIEKAKIRNLIIIEKDIELLKPSLYILNWKKIIEYFNTQNRNIFLVIESDPEIAARKTLSYIYYSMDVVYLSYFYLLKIFNSKFFTKFEKHLKELAYLLTRGWGFFDDEFMSFIHTHINIQNKIPLYKGKYKVPQNSAACIVGSGPSIEKQIEFIKNNFDKLTIFSAGTSIGILNKNNIIPDFHVEVERTKITYDSLILSLKGAKEEFFKVPVVANNPMYPKVFEVSDKNFMYVKPNDACSAFLKKFFPEIYLSNPTVVNAALALAIFMGFNQIFLCGVDLGFIDPNKHHATDTVYYNTKFTEQFSYNQILKKKDGTIVYTTDDFLWTKKHIELLIKQNLYKTKVYNLSNILPIENTIPIENIDKINTKHLLFKNKYTKHILEDFDICQIDTIKITKQIKKDYRCFSKKIMEILNEDIRNRTDFAQIIVNINKILNKLKEKNESAYIMMKGSIQHAEKFILQNSFLIYDQKRAVNFIKESKNEIKKFLNASYKNIKIFEDIVQNNNKLDINELEKINLGQEGFYIFDWCDLT